MLQELETPKFPDHLLYLKEEVDALPEQENYVPYHEDDFMFLFSDDKHDNMSLLSELYSAEYTRIDSLCVCKQEKRHLHDILNIMTRSMSKSKKADVPAIYPLKGEHKKPEHVRPQSVEKQMVPIQSEQRDHDQLEQRDQVEPADRPDVVIYQKQMRYILHLQKCMITQFFKKDQKFIHKD